MDIPVASTVFAVAGAVFFSIQLIPQIILNYRRHHARGLNSSMMLLWALAGVPLGVYNISRPLHVALQVQAQILTFLSLVTWGQCLWYNRRWSMKKVLVVTILTGALLGGIEVALVFALQEAHRQHLEWPFLLMAVVSAALLATGVLRHYVDIWRHRTVRGISFLFVTIDALGDLTSALALVFAPPIDWPGVAIYAFEFALWLGIYVCAWALGVEKNQLDDGAELSRREAGDVGDSGQTSGATTSRSLALPIREGSIRSRASTIRSERSMTVFRTASRE